MMTAATLIARFEDFAEPILGAKRQSPANPRGVGVAAGSLDSIERSSTPLAIAPRFSQQVGAGIVAEAAFGAVVEGDVATLPREDGEYSDPQSGVQIGEDGIERFRVFGSAAAARIGVEAGAPLRSWDLLALLLGSEKLAARLARAHRAVDGEFTTPDLLRDVAELADLETQAERREWVEHRYPKGGGAADRDDLMSLLTGPLPAESVSIPLGGIDKLVIRLGGSGHGIYRTVDVTTDDGSQKTRLERLTDWIAVRERQYDSVTADIVTGELATTGAALYDLLVVEGSGAQYRSRERLSEERSTDPRSVVAATAARVELPTAPAKRAMVGNAIRRLSAVAAPDHDRVYSSMGWALSPTGGLEYLAPAGSVDASGATGRRPRFSSDGDESALGDLGGSIGWTETASSHDEIIDFCSALGFYRSSFASHQLPLTMIGVLLQSALPMDRLHPTVWLMGQPSAGKTLCATAIQSAFTERFHRNPAVTLLDSTIAGINGMMRLWRHGLLLADDFKLLPGYEGQRARDAALQIPPTTYASAAGARGTVEGGVRSFQATELTAIVTAEAMLDRADSAVERMLCFELADGDLDRGRLFSSEWHQQHAPAMLRGYGWLLSRFAAFADENGGLPSLRRRALQAAEAWQAADPARSASRSFEHAGRLFAGWRLLLEELDSALGERFPEALEALGFAPEYQGSLDAVISRLETALHELAQERARATAEDAISARILRVLSETIAGGGAHLADAGAWDLAYPRTGAAACGWTLTPSGPDDVWRSAGVRVGQITTEGAHAGLVLLNLGQVATILHRAGEPRYSPQYLRRELASVTISDALDPDGKAKKSLGFESRPRGVVVDAAALGIDIDFGGS